MNDESLMRALTPINKGVERSSHHFIKNISFLKQQIQQTEMKKIKQTSDKIIIEFNIHEFNDIQDFFKEQTEAVNATVKFNYDTINKLLSIKLENSTLLNNKRLQRIDQMLQKNKKMLKK